MGVTDEDLQSLFSEYGSVASAAVITDRETGRSRGFGFVELEDGADAAIEALSQDYKATSFVRSSSKQTRSGGGRPGGGGGRRF